VTAEGRHGAHLPALHLGEWEKTKDTLHLWVQILGKVRLASAPFRTHWWHAPLQVSARGLTTGRLVREGVVFDVELDFVEHALAVRTAGGGSERLPLHDGLSVAAFHANLMAALDRLGVRVVIRPQPFGVPMTTPFPEDTEHASYDAEYVERFWRILLAVNAVLDEFAGWFVGKQSPVHVYWHSFDLALSRFSGRRAPEPEAVDAVTREAYSHEVIAFGFWAGDRENPAPALYSYTAPEPEGLTEQALQPKGAAWAPSGGMAVLPYEEVRAAPDARRAMLMFWQTAYDAGARMAGWDRQELASAVFADGWRELDPA
jgi:hypothetical protein